MKISKISYKTISDFDMVIEYKMGAAKKKTRVMEQLWLKYQPLVKSSINKYSVRAKIMLDYEYGDLHQDMYFQFLQVMDNIDPLMIDKNFSYGSFLRMYLDTYLYKTITQKNNEMTKRYWNLTSEQNKEYDYNLEWYRASGPSLEDQMISLEVEELYDKFKRKHVDKRDKKLLKSLEKYKGMINDKDIAVKLGYKSHPAFLYNKERLKRQYVDFMKKEGYNLGV